MGMRLKNPSLCPKPIANIIQKCFDIEPDKRPNFKQIKDLLHISYNSLFIEPSKKKGMKNSMSSDYTTLFNTSSDSSSSSMKARYHQVLNANKEKQEAEITLTASGPYLEIEMSGDNCEGP